MVEEAGMSTALPMFNFYKSKAVRRFSEKTLNANNFYR